MSDAKRPEIKPAPNGPLLVKGMDQIVRYTDGKEFEGGETTALCRCGASKNKPFCDGTHQTIGFTDEKAANRANVDAMTREHADDAATPSAGAQIAPRRAVVSERMPYAEVAD